HERAELRRVGGAQRERGGERAQDCPCRVSRLAHGVGPRAAASRDRLRMLRRTPAAARPKDVKKRGGRERTAPRRGGLRSTISDWRWSPVRKAAVRVERACARWAQYSPTARAVHRRRARVQSGTTESVLAFFRARRGSDS